jgi:hypothetical protein
MVVKYFKRPEYKTIFSISRPSKIYPNWHFCSEMKPSGNPGHKQKIVTDLMQRDGVEDGLDEARVVGQDEDPVGSQPQGNALLRPDLLQHVQQLVRQQLLQQKHQN